MSAIGLRVADAADVETLVRLAGGLRDYLRQAEPDDATFRARLPELLADASTEFLVATMSDGEACGYLQLRLRASLWYGREAEVEDLFLSAGARGQGVGTALLDFAVRRARHHGCTSIGLNTNENNDGAVRLYEQAGFDARRARWHGGRQIWLVRELRPDQGTVG